MAADAAQDWAMRVSGGLSAYFQQPDGSSLPGTDWAITLTRGDEAHAVTVRTYYADDLAQDLRNDSGYQAQTAMQYLDGLLQQDWDPKEPRPLAITLTNPPGTPPQTSRQGAI